MATKLNIKIDQGTTYTAQLTFKDPMGVLIDVSTHTFRGQIRERYDASVILASFTFSNVSLGVVEMKMIPSVTAALPIVPSIDNKRMSYKAIYDVEQEISPTEITRIIEGECEISPEVTR